MLMHCFPSCKALALLSAELHIIKAQRLENLIKNDFPQHGSICNNIIRKSAIANTNAYVHHAFNANSEYQRSRSASTAYNKIS